MDPIKFSGYENCYEDDLQEDDQHVYLLSWVMMNEDVLAFSIHILSGNRS